MKTGRKSIDLLPGRPSRLSKVDGLISGINSIVPLLDSAPPSFAIAVTPRLVVSWACSHYRGFLATASGSQRIPNMAGADQFMLADNAPELTTAFNNHSQGRSGRVLFHGTTLDRLYAVLTQGLQVLSNTPLQKHGAVHGSGIYLAEEPSISIGNVNSLGLTGAFATKFDEYTSKGVLLAVEHIGGAVGRNGVYVEPEPARLLLRYVFLVPQGWVAPVRAHIEPALLSNFNTLRLGARKT